MSNFDLYILFPAGSWYLWVWGAALIFGGMFLATAKEVSENKAIMIKVSMILLGIACMGLGYETYEVVIRHLNIPLSDLHVGQQFYHCIKGNSFDACIGLVATGHF